jgi:dolichol-phosphate mannosyltransferase
MSGPAWLIIPTYNEVANLEPLVTSVLPLLARAAPAGHRVLIVDDSSPDGTGRLADAMAARLESVEVLHRPSRAGLGPAYLAGFSAALEGGAAYLLQMDADFSHDPADVPRLLNRAEQGADLVLGSRYVSGGGVVDWGATRRSISRAGCWYARKVLGVPIRDLTGGFKCFRRTALEAIDLPSIRSQGYAFQVEMTYRALREGLSVVEIPILFRERREGASKMSTGIVVEAAWRVPRLRLSPTTTARSRK